MAAISAWVGGACSRASGVTEISGRLLTTMALAPLATMRLRTRSASSAPAVAIAATAAAGDVVPAAS